MGMEQRVVEHDALSNDDSLARGTHRAGLVGRPSELVQCLRVHLFFFFQRKKIPQGKSKHTSLRSEAPLLI
jgi:hypothetical protein